MGFTSDQIFTQYIVEYSMKYFCVLVSLVILRSKFIISQAKIQIGEQKFVFGLKRKIIFVLSFMEIKETRFYLNLSLEFFHSD